MSQARRLPRPRNFDDVCDYLHTLDGRTSTLTDKLNEGLAKVHTDVGRLTAEVSATRSMVAGGRGRENSVYDFDLEVAEYRRALREGVKDPHRRNFDSQFARAKVRQAIESVSRDEKAARYDAWKKNLMRVALGVAIGVLVALILYKLGVAR